jgi:hypothetical protein
MESSKSVATNVDSQETCLSSSIDRDLSIIFVITTQLLQRTACGFHAVKVRPQLLFLRRRFPRPNYSNNFG